MSNRHRHSARYARQQGLSYRPKLPGEEVITCPCGATFLVWHDNGAVERIGYAVMVTPGDPHCCHGLGGHDDA